MATRRMTEIGEHTGEHERHEGRGASPGAAKF